MPRREAPSRCLVIWGAARVGTIVRGIAVQRYVGVKHEHRQASRHGVLRHVLARLRRHGCCRPGGLARGHRHRSRRRSAGLRPHGRDHGLRGRAHLRRPLQPRRDHRPVGRRPLPGGQDRRLHRRPGPGRHRRVGRALCDRQRQGGVHALRRLRRQRLRRSFPGGVHDAGGDRHRAAAHLLLPARDPRRHRQAGPGRPAWRRWPAAWRSPSSISSASRWTTRR